MRGVPFWGMAGFLGLYGVQQVPQIHRLGSAWSTGLANGTHYLAIGLGFYFTAEGGRRMRAWIASKVHVHVEGSFWAGAKRTTDPTRRDS